MAKNYTKIDKLQVNEISSRDVSIIPVLEKLRYSTSFTLDDGNDLVYKSYVDGAIGVATPLVIAIPAGSDYPFNVSVSNFPDFINFINGFRLFKQVMVLDTTNNRIINDVVIDEHFTNASKTTYTSIDIYGHDSGDRTTTIDDLIITLYK